MNRFCFPRMVLAGTFLVLAAAVAQTGKAAAQSQGSWSQVPALPTSCYVQRDQPLDQLQTARNALQEELNGIETVNNALKERLGAVDISVQASRTQAFLMKNPQRGMEIMQSMASGGQAVSDAVLKHDEWMKSWGQDLNAAKEAYQAELKVIQPAATKFTNESMLGGNPAQARAAAAAYNPAYEKICRDYFTPATAKFPVLLTRLRTYFVEDYVPALEPGVTALKGQFEMYGIDGQGYRNPEHLKAAIEYLNQAIEVFRSRRQQSLGTAP